MAVKNELESMQKKVIMAQCEALFTWSGRQKHNKPTVKTVIYPRNFPNINH